MLPTITLFKKMTKLKKENQDLQREVSQLNEALEGMRQMNEQLEYLLAHETEKNQRLEQQRESSTTIPHDSQLQKTMQKDPSLFKHSSMIRIDQDFLAQASPEQLQKLKKSVVEGPTNGEMSMIDHLSVVMKDMRKQKRGGSRRVHEDEEEEPVSVQEMEEGDFSQFLNENYKQSFAQGSKIQQQERSHML